MCPAGHAWGVPGGWTDPCINSMSWNETYDTNGWLPRRHLLSPFVGPYRHDIDIASSPVVVQNHSPPRRPIDCAAEPLVVYQVGSQASHLRPTSTSATTPKRLATAIVTVSFRVPCSSLCLHALCSPSVYRLVVLVFLGIRTNPTLVSRGLVLLLLGLGLACCTALKATPPSPIPRSGHRCVTHSP